VARTEGKLPSGCCGDDNLLVPMPMRLLVDVNFDAVVERAFRDVKILLTLHLLWISLVLI